MVNLTYVDDGRVLDTPEDLSSAFEHAIQTEVALKGYDMAVEIVLKCMKDGEVTTIGAEEEDDEEEDEYEVEEDEEGDEDDVVPVAVTEAAVEARALGKAKEKGKARKAPKARAVARARKDTIHPSHAIKKLTHIQGLTLATTHNGGAMKHNQVNNVQDSGITMQMAHSPKTRAQTLKAAYTRKSIS